ncbi:MAG: PrsW family intramembrane metalloprotease [Pleurocapsa minor GSE-CHR-MK-17-07R]|jgi:RsiW-degrading membrane proteinase PrsW (M82 family)|nr:PrsW family intramembrane metalloprotease [Pleurocapsa minor GSE-CHR-MK 17-07R]
MILPVLIAIAIPLGFLYIVWVLEVFSVSRFRVMISAIGWGVAAFIIALVIQSALARFGVISASMVPITTAPFLEELLKGIGIVVLAQRMIVRYAVDGASYGFAIGTGFAVAENLLYLFANPSLQLEVSLARVLSVSLMHAFNTGFVGAVIGSNFFRRSTTLSAKLLGAFALAAAAHLLFNLVVRNVSGLPLILIAILIGMTGLTAIVTVIIYAVRAERKWINEMLENDQVSAGERAAVINPDQMIQIVAKHRDQLGHERADLLLRYTQLLAQRSILQKTLTMNQRRNYEDTLRKQLMVVDRQLEQLRREMGMYMRIWLRSLLPSEESEVWQGLTNELGDDSPLLRLVSTLNARQVALSPESAVSRRAALKATQLFSDLDDEEITDLVALLEEVPVRLMQDVMEQGKVDDHLYIVASGSLSASAIDEGGNETIITGYTAGGTFGELSMIDLEPPPATITALSDSLLYRLSREDLITLIYAKPQISLRMMKQLVGQVRQGTELLIWLQKTSTAGTMPHTAPFIL